MRLASRLLAPLVVVFLGLAALTACTGGQEPVSEGATPEEVMADARRALVETSGLRLDLSTDDLPQGVTGITSARGVATTAPAAFDGTIAIVIGGQPVEVPVVAVDGTVHAQLPFTEGYSEVDPAEYGAPDPAALLDPDTGFPSLLTATEDLVEGESVRGGTDNSEVLTEYTGTVPGAAVQQVIPSATGDSFDVAWQVTGSGELRKAALTGVFYPDSPPMTYTVDFTDYGTEQEITAP